jgi:hypothetical protein
MWRTYVKLAGVYLKSGGAWWRTIGATRLKAFAPYSWIPILTVASLSLLVSYCNYRLGTSGRPELEFTNGTIEPNSRTLLAYWHNPGRMIAWYAKAKLFDVNERGKRADQPFAVIDVTGAGPKVFAGMGANMVYHFQSDQFPSRILVCAMFSDENQRSYRQNFLLAVRKTDTPGPWELIEQMPPIEQNCE